ncbi:MAG: YdcF family protein [Pseudomonadota bacterium]
MRALKWFVVLLSLACAVPFLATLGFLYLHANPDPMPDAAAIVVLSGPGAIDTIPIGDTKERVERGVALWKAGHAPLIVMSGAGGTIASTRVPDSQGMRRLAESLGVPSEAIVEDDMSYSTLQNAWNTAKLEEIDPSLPVILVTSRYHLPRAWASFSWAGFQQIIPVAADTGPPEINEYVFWESVKWPFNVFRAVVASLTLMAGAAEDRVLAWLE